MINQQQRFSPLFADFHSVPLYLLGDCEAREGSGISSRSWLPANNPFLSKQNLAVFLPTNTLSIYIDVHVYLNFRPHSTECEEMDTTPIGNKCNACSGFGNGLRMLAVVYCINCQEQYCLKHHKVRKKFFLLCSNQ